MLGLLALAAFSQPECTCETEYCKPFEIEGGKLPITLGPSFLRLFGLEVKAGVTFTLEIGRGHVFYHKCNCTGCCPGLVRTRPESVVAGRALIFPEVPKDHPLYGRYEAVDFWAPAALEGNEQISEDCKCFKDSCHVVQEFTSLYTSVSLSLGASISLLGVSLGVDISLPHQRAEFECTGICEPGPDRKICKNPPAVVGFPKDPKSWKYTVAPIALPAGEVNQEFSIYGITVRDVDLLYGDQLQIKAFGPGEEPLDVIIEPHEQDKTLVKVVIKGRVQSDWPKNGDIWIDVIDSCGKRSSENIPYFLVYPPQVEEFYVDPFENAACNGLRKAGHFVKYYVWDPNPVCSELEVWVEGIGGRATIGVTEFTSTRVWACREQEKAEILVRFCPERWAEDYKVIIKVVNLKYSLVTTKNMTLNPNSPIVEVEPSKLLVVPRQVVSAMVIAKDPDGHGIILQKTGGPGFFPTVKGRGRVQGVWTWTVPDYLRSYAGYVSFAATDFSKVGYGFLYVRTITPPQASSAHAVVRRGGLGQAYAYVHDPDDHPLQHDRSRGLGLSTLLAIQGSGHPAAQGDAS
ncbi:MAG: hypothetical protein ABDI20_08075 [Candidatus Bipolaricaulaceae bacterium]